MKGSLVIGLGNEQRGDDAAGLWVARRLRGLVDDRTRVVEHEEAGLGMIELWEGAGDVLVVDAIQGGGELGELVEWDALETHAIEPRGRASSHGFGLAEAIEVARVLERLPRKLVVLGIEASHFEYGEAPSDAVQRAVDRAVERAVRILRDHAGKA